jgi:oligosaccharide repeat unit polymerase
MIHTRARPRYLTLSLGIFSLAVATIGAGLVSQQNSVNNEAWALAFLAIACAFPVILSLLRRRFDIFEPIYAFILSTFVYFVLVPGFALRANDFTFLGSDMTPMLGKVTLLAILALFGFSIGYYSRTAPVNSVPIRSAAAEPLEPPPLRRFLEKRAGILFLFFTGLVALWIVVARFPLSALWVLGGDVDYGSAWNMAVGPQIGYLYAARESLPACLLMLIAFRPTRRWPVHYLVLAVFLAIFFAGSGARFRMLLLILGVLAYYFLERGARPRLWQSLLVAFALFYVVVGGIGFLRGQSSGSIIDRTQTGSEGGYSVNDAWGVMVGSSEIASSTALLVRVVPSYQPYFHGASFLNVFTQPIPRFLWPEKPQTIGEDFFTQLWPPGTTLPFWALFYLNFGPLGIVPGMIIWGWVSRRIYDAYRANPGDRLAQIQLAVYWPFIVHAYGRGGDNFAFNVYGFLYVLIPVWVMMYFRSRYATAKTIRKDGSRTAAGENNQQIPGAAEVPQNAA